MKIKKLKTTPLSFEEVAAVTGAIDLALGDRLWMLVCPPDVVTKIPDRDLAKWMLARAQHTINTKDCIEEKEYYK